MQLNNQWIVGASALVAAGGSFAQSEKFEGSSLNLGFGDMKFKNEASSTTVSKWKNTSNIEFVHLKSLNDKWLLGMGVGLGTGAAKMNVNGSEAGTAYFGFNGSEEWHMEQSDCSGACYAYQFSGSEAKISQNVSVSIIPAYAFSQRQLGFLRIGFSVARFEKTSSANESGWVDPVVNEWFQNNVPSGLPFASQGNTGKANIYGVVLGAGYRYQFESNWFFQGEYKFVQYDRNSRINAKPSLEGLVLGLGYHF